MTAIFISHNSNDAKEAAALKRWLADNGWDDVFLDIDAKDGLSPGERWKDALRIAADRCEAVLCLVSPTWLASAECKLEFRYAEQLRKHLFLAIIKPCDPKDLPPDWQWCPLYGDGAKTTVGFAFREQPAECAFLSHGLERLKHGLEKAGISAEHFPWPPANDPDRAPYRGLKPLEAADAAVFFGRNAQTLHGMETLWDIRRNGIERLLVILGASGSGKSSFMRAGLLPRLARDERQFFPLSVIRPRNAVLFGAEGLAPALAAAFAGLGRNLTLGAIEQELKAGPEAFKALLAQLEQWLLQLRPLEPLADEVGPLPPSLVFPIDQAEELFNPDGAVEAAPFLDLLGGLLIDRSEPGMSVGAHRRALVVLTIRSDRYERLQTAPGLSEIKPRLFDLRPFPPSQFERVINGPAERATQAGRKLTIEPRLTERLLADFSAGADTLPLLGFALEKLYHKYGTDGDLTLEEYEAIRGSHETVQAAIFQEAIDSALAEPYRPPPIPAERAEQYQGMRRAFIPYLARINPETNEPLRQVANMRDLPSDVHPLVERLVEARLLIRDKDAIEVTHESLLRQWPSLRGWLTEDRDKLRLLENIRQSAAEWHKEHQRDDLLVHRDGRLKDAEALLATPGYVVSADSDERAYLNACTAAQQAREQEKEERAEAERIAKERELEQAKALAEAQRQRADEQAAARSRQRRLSWALFALLALAVGAALYGRHQRNQALQAADVAEARRQEADEQRQIALARQLASQAEVALDSTGTGLVRSVLLGVESLRRFRTLEADQILRRGLALLRAMVARMEHKSSGVVWAVTFSPDGKWLATGSSGDDYVARVWEAGTGREVARMAHEGPVVAVTFSPDGKWLATRSKDGTARVWEAGTGREVARMAHKDAAGAVTFSPGGKWLATGSEDGTAWVWEAGTGQEVARIAPKGAVWAVTFSPDGKWLATGSEDGTARVWEAGTGREVARVAHEHKVVAVAFSPDGKWLATGSNDRTARVWEAGTGRELARMPHNNDLRAVAFSPDGKWLATGSYDRTARVWEAGTGQEAARMAHEYVVWAVAFSPDGKWLATGSEDGTARVWEAVIGQEMARVAHEYVVWAVAFSPDGKWLATGSKDGTARVWEAGTGREVARMAHEGPVVAVTFSPDGKWLATRSKDGTARVWEAGTGREVARMAHEGPVEAVTFSPDGKWLATRSKDGTARVWEAGTGREVARMAHEGPVVAVTFSPDGKWLATRSEDGTARVWEAGTGREVARMAHKDAAKDAAGAVTFSPDGKWLATGSYDRTAWVWEAGTGREVARIEHEWSDGGDMVVVTFSPDGKWLATGGRDSTARVWEAVTGREVARMAHEEIDLGNMVVVTFSPDGKWLATGSEGGTARVWEAVTGQEVARMAHEDAVEAVTFSPDGKWLATGSKNGTARVWEAGTGQEVARMAHEDAVEAVTFSPDGKWLATGSKNGTARVWLWRTKDLLSEACARLPRNFDEKNEWSQYLHKETYRKTCPNLP